MVRRLAAFAWLSLVPPLLAQEPARVWVNTRSGVYHCPGTQHYGKTTRGEYLAEGDAEARGYRANGGVRCTSQLPAPTQGVESVAAATVTPPARPAADMRACVVERIVDGDTLHCRDGTRVRLIGIDASERGLEPTYTASRAALASYAPIGATVDLEYDRDRTDRNGRDLAYVWSASRLVNWEMLRNGWVVAHPFANTNRYEAPFAAAEAAARGEQRGHWSTPGFECLFRHKRAPAC